MTMTKMWKEQIQLTAVSEGINVLLNELKPHLHYLSFFIFGIRL